MQLAPTIPILRSFDDAQARAFYVDYLGFAVDWTHRFEPSLPLYMQVSRGGCLLHLSEHHGDATPGSAVRLGCSDLDALLSELRSKAYGRLRPAIEDMPWGTRDLALVDPFGNRLIFTAPADD